MDLTSTWTAMMPSRPQQAKCSRTTRGCGRSASASSRESFRRTPSGRGTLPSARGSAGPSPLGRGVPPSRGREGSAASLNLPRRPPPPPPPPPAPPSRVHRARRQLAPPRAAAAAGACAARPPLRVHRRGRRHPQASRCPPKQWKHQTPCRRPPAGTAAPLVCRAVPSAPARSRSRASSAPAKPPVTGQTASSPATKLKKGHPPCRGSPGGCGRWRTPLRRRG
mmetsp:Transcript_34725/g.82365  ORF Transcript_34725/g.82365 Transcript_34725/m.82365 type:complete len:223 (-) Transcript_34725:2301-2969(-)